MKRESELRALELERIKLAQLEKQVELQNGKRDSTKGQGDLDASNKKIENLTKSIKTLTITVPTRAESFNLLFQSLEKAFRTKNVPDSLRRRFYATGRPDFQLNGLYQRISVEVFISDTITTAPVVIPSADVRADMGSQGLKLADTCESGSKVEVLIGSDVFWRIIDAYRVEKINGTVTCVPTIFGFVLRVEIWERCMDWDDDLPEDLRRKWIGWCDEIRMLDEMVIPRNFLQGCGKEMTEVHVFCDATPRVYGASAYLRKRLLRVGGRIRNFNLPDSVKHPLILPKDHPITTMLVKLYQLNYLHAGVQAVHSAMRQVYWIVGVMYSLRKVGRNCVVCARFRSEFSKQIMAYLPSSRVRPGRAFLRSGTDFCGPFLVNPRHGRCIKSMKMYVCIFACLITKALHIELVSDPTIEAFLASFKCFVGRRGKPIELFGDCGTNFVGAKHVLKLRCSEAIGLCLANEGVIWRMNVPSAPHFGGLWEAAVKSMKHHLRRVMGSQFLAQEEFLTVLVEIEAVLYSRLLVAALNDPEDLTVITPGHFLVGEELLRIPEPDLTDQKLPIRDGWKLIVQISVILEILV
ncbi:hypothetical protein AVEN_28611-1 [Araneus ventricosus]|uniref:Integrase catalytic domain-containing protein n=1 Tax=Araneus ventricosus TaxID=182803 RepID=A0A4Y2DF71_ARAVE|nr:hypothetical protein AVEN_28611-1 [Araneus ventricosus]